MLPTSEEGRTICRPFYNYRFRVVGGIWSILDGWISDPTDDPRHGCEVRRVSKASQKSVPRNHHHTLEKAVGKRRSKEDWRDWRNNR